MHSPDAVILSTEAASHGFDDIGALQTGNTITATAEVLSGRWTGKAMFTTNTAHGFKKGQPISISGSTSYNKRTRILKVVSTTKFIANLDYTTADNAGTISLLGGRGAWVAMMPIGAALTAAEITTFTFHRSNGQTGTQDIGDYSQDQLYHFPQVIKEIQISSGNVRLFRAASMNIDGKDLEDDRTQ